MFIDITCIVCPIAAMWGKWKRSIQPHILLQAGFYNNLDSLKSKDSPKRIAQP